MTLKEKYIAGLLKKGEQKLKDTACYTIFTRAHGGYYYIGTNGALRIGRTRSRSVPASDAFKSSLIQLGAAR